MANKNLFATIMGKLKPAAKATNEAGGKAYSLTPEQALAQYALTGCLNDTFYANASEQLADVLSFASKCSAEFVAKVAITARAKGHMKDMPALLVAHLSTRDAKLFDVTFDRVIDSPRMLRTFVQIMRSGVTGRKSLGSLPKRKVRKWLESRSDAAIFRAQVGNDPSLADIIRMTHPKPANATRAALYAHLIGKPADETQLPELVREYEAFKVSLRA